MNELSILGEEALVDALLMEIGTLLGILVDSGTPGCIDLRGLPLSDFCLATLEDRLGHGEITAHLEAAGSSKVRETSFPGVWWIHHQDEAARTIALQIEVTPVPEILRASRADMIAGLSRLPENTVFASFRRAGSMPVG